MGKSSIIERQEGITDMLLTTTSINAQTPTLRRSDIAESVGAVNQMPSPLKLPMSKANTQTPKSLRTSEVVSTLTAKA